MHERTTPDFSTGFVGLDIFPETSSLVDEEAESIAVNSQHSAGAGSGTEDMLPATVRKDTIFRVRKRGRPRIHDDNSDIACKERRKTQLRIAQRAYRSRKEERIAALSKKVTELEQKLLIYRTLYLGTRSGAVGSVPALDWATQSDLLAGIKAPPMGIDVDMQSPPSMYESETGNIRSMNVASSLQHVSSTELMAEIESRSRASDVSVQSTQFTRDSETAMIMDFSNYCSPSQHAPPTVAIPPDSSYMMLEDVSSYEGWPHINPLPTLPFL
ncbi:hypothetical protein BJX64DRAFT_207419 [Aspergillus heterothallicus]